MGKILCVDTQTIEDYMNSKDVQTAINVELKNQKKWEVCSDGVYHSYKQLYPNLKVQVLDILKSGVNIFKNICNFL